MVPEQFTITIALVGIVIIVASLLSGAIERSGVPLVAVFLGLGAVLGPFGLGLLDVGLRSPILQTLATLALALVLFSDAVTLDPGDLRTRLRLTWRMLGPGTLIPAVLMAVAAHALLGLAWPAAAILGASLASTDPVLLRSVLRARHVPPDARVALRVESGMNDVVLLPVVVIAMLLLRQDGSVTSVTISRSAISLFLLGPALGALVGWVGIRMLGWIRSRIGVRRDYESLYALGLAFTAYAAAEAVHGSGFLAAFAAGLLVAAQDVELCDCFLEYGEATAEMLLLLTFVALGTSLIWQGVGVIDGRTMLFAMLALGVRTVVLYPTLLGLGLPRRDRRLIALFGPRGLSSLLFALLPVFAGLPGAEYVFTVVCLVVLLSVLIHGTGIAFFLRAGARGDGAARPIAGVAPRGPATALDAAVPERIEIAEVQERMARGERVIPVDARTERSLALDDRQAAGAVSIPPDSATRTAQSIGLSHHGTLVVYCA